MKKVLVITYYWPPCGGAGVQRWLFFVKYLREFGWEPIVFTVENPSYPSEDTSLFEEIPMGLKVIKYPIWEPYELYKKFLGMKKNSNVQHGFLREKEVSHWKNDVSNWIRSNFFIPDARKFWIKPASRFLNKELKKNPPDAIISTGPPHTCHMIGLKLHQKTGLPWVADFRDPWTEIDFAEDLKLTKLAFARHRKFEKKVLSTATQVVSVGWHMQAAFKKISDHQHYTVITNGHDFVENKKTDYQPERFEILHLGSMNQARNPHELWKVLADLKKTNQLFAMHLSIKLIGKFDYQVKKDIETYHLLENSTFIEYVPHNEVFSHLTQASVLLLALNRVVNVEGIITGKVFEYLAAKRPILCIGSENGDAAKILKKSNAGFAVDFEDAIKLKKDIKTLFEDYQKNDSRFTFVNSEQFTRRNLTGKLAKLLHRITD